METKTTIGIVVVLAVLLAVSGNVLIITHSQKIELQKQIDALGSQVQNLSAQISTLQAQVHNLENENAELKAANLQLIDTWWQDHRPLLGDPYVRTCGTIVNFGRQTAHNVTLTVKIYQEAVLLKTQTFSLQDIYGRWYAKFDVQINYSGDATNIERSLSYS